MTGLLPGPVKSIRRKVAQNYKDIVSPETEEYFLLQDPHPLAYLRTNVSLQQFDKFYETFGIKEGDNMYLAPEDRIAVW